MKCSLKAAMKNPFFLSYVALYGVLVLVLHTAEGFGLVLPLFVLLFFGVGLTGLAWAVTRRIAPPLLPVKQPVAECGLLAGYLLVMVAYLTWGVERLQNLFPTEPSKSVAIVAVKLALFVVFPLALFRWLWKYTPGDFLKLSTERSAFLRVLLSVSLVLILFNLAFGQGLATIRAAGLGTWPLTVGIPLAYLWLIVEVGIVEEFFFRALIQSRLTALFQSEIAGVVLMSLIFGLAHAPGLYFRTGQTLEAVGPSPSPLMAIGYSVVVVSVTGFFLGILWSRTKNLALLALIHAAGDLVPNAAEILKAWGIG